MSFSCSPSCVAHSCVDTVTGAGTFRRDLSSCSISFPLRFTGSSDFDRLFPPAPAPVNLPLQLAPAITQQGQWYRLLTPVVLHGSLAHLLINSMSFNSVGPVVGKTPADTISELYCTQIILGEISSWKKRLRTPLYSKLSRRAYLGRRAKSSWDKGSWQNQRPMKISRSGEGSVFGAKFPVGLEPSSFGAARESMIVLRRAVPCALENVLPAKKEAYICAVCHILVRGDQSAARVCSDPFGISLLFFWRAYLGMLVFCEQVESVLGKKKFVAVYALAGIAGNVLSCVVNPRTPVRGRESGRNRAASDRSQGQ